MDAAQSWSFPIIRVLEFFIPFAFGGRESGGMYFGKFYIQDAQGAGGSPWFDSVFFGLPLLCSVILLLVNVFNSNQDKKQEKFYAKWV